MHRTPNQLKVRLTSSTPTLLTFGEPNLA